MKRFHLLIWLILLVLITNPVHAQGSGPAIPAEPPAGMYILDELDWLTSAQEDSINATISGLDKDGIAEIAVVTLDDCGMDKEAFRKSLFDTWGIGHTDDNDGLLILVCWYGGDASRRSIEQLYGPAWKWTLSPTKTDQIAQEKFVPAFQQDKPGDGLVGMIRTYNVLLRTQNTSGSPLAALTLFMKRNTENILWISVFLVVLLVQWAWGKFVPESIRERFGREDSTDRDGFDGGRSDGGGGSSTRF